MRQRTRVGLGEEMVEDLGERLIRDTGYRIRGAYEHYGSVVVERSGDLGGKPGLSGPWLASYEHDLAIPLLRPRPDRLEGLELVSPSHKGNVARRREQRR